MNIDMKDIASLLDDTISKGVRFFKRSKIEQIEDEIVKGFSHDVMNPMSVSQFSNIHNPYQWADDGFIPLSAQSLQGSNPDPTAYLQNKIFYEKYIDQRKSLSHFEDLLSNVRLEKAGAVPSGTVHKFKDGQSYVKEETGWEHHTDNPSLVHALNSEDPEHKKQANDIIEDHAKKTISHTNESKKREVKSKQMMKFKKDIMKEFEKMLDKKLSNGEVDEQSK